MYAAQLEKTYQRGRPTVPPKRQKQDSLQNGKLDSKQRLNSPQQAVLFPRTLHWGPEGAAKINGQST